MPTLTIDLELPEAEYQFASGLTPVERRLVASTAVTAAFANARNVSALTHEEDDQAWETLPMTAHEIESLAVAVAQMDAGEVTDGDAFFEQFYKERGWVLKP